MAKYRCIKELSEENIQCWYIEELDYIIFFPIWLRIATTINNISENKAWEFLDLKLNSKKEVLSEKEF